MSQINSSQCMELDKGMDARTNQDGEEDALWSIEDDTLFQPCGLINHNDGADKSVFVTWNEYYLLNFRFKKSKMKKVVEMTKVRIPLPTIGRTHLRSIHMLQCNTLLLMSDGHVYCFGSIKSLHIIGWLSGVRCFSATQNGFSVIRHDEQAQRLLLEVYEDLPGLEKGESTLQHSYDITYDEQNIFHSDWHTDHYTLQTLTVGHEQHEFVEKLFGMATIGQQLHIFSVGGHVFVLCPQDGAADTEMEYIIRLECVYASNVNLIHVLPERNLCLVYLSCGSIDIWYVSKLTHLKHRQMYYTGADWLDYDASSDNGDFFYTDGAQLVGLRFEYDEQMDDCQVHRSAKYIAGMQACTWVRQIKQLVCLSDNNIFYRIPFALHDAMPSNDVNALTPADIEHLRNDAQLLAQYEAQPDELKAEIAREHEKQQLIAVARPGKSHTAGLEASMVFCRQLPDFGSKTLLLHTAMRAELNSSGIYALLELKLHSSPVLLQSEHWQLLVYHGHQGHMYYVTTELLLNRKCCVVVPLRKRANKLLPEFTMQLVAFVELHKQINAVLLPVHIKESAGTFGALFSDQLNAINLFNEPQLKDIILKNSKETTKVVISQKFKAPASASFDKIADICNGVVKNDALQLYFGDSELNISASTDDNSLVLSLESEDTSALYYFKQHLMLNVDNEPNETSENAEAALKQQIMKFQCQIERLYGTAFQDGDEFKTNNKAIHLEALLSEYEKIRNTMF